ncbi:MAG: DUF4920 domain-containing protein [Acidobacteriota bacterium]|nr:DUF4920 domain-containing protein [Acidobacteriota bacterium]
MKARSVWTVVVLLLVAAAVGGVAAVAAAEIARFGEALTPDLEPTPIASILADPDAWVGEWVQIAGKVSGVCTRQGCWLDLTSADDATLRVKVEDGVIVFPPEAKGRQAVAEGEVEIVEMDRSGYEAWRRHVAEEEGRDFDPAEVGDGPYRTVRLRGSGAEIE